MRVNAPPASVPPSCRGRRRPRSAGAQVPSGVRHSHRPPHGKTCPAAQPHAEKNPPPPPRRPPGPIIPRPPPLPPPPCRGVAAAPPAVSDVPPPLAAATPLPIGRNPVGSGLNPLGIGKNPVGSGLHPLGIGRNPVGSGFHPIPIGSRPVPSGKHPVGSGRHSLAGGNRPPPAEPDPPRATKPAAPDAGHPSTRFGVRRDAPLAAGSGSPGASAGRSHAQAPGLPLPATKGMSSVNDWVPRVDVLVHPCRRTFRLRVPRRARSPPGTGWEYPTRGTQCRAPAPVPCSVRLYGLLVRPTTNI